MMYLDTHVLVKLWLGAVGDLGPIARKTLSAEDLMVSPAAILELERLHEIRRLSPTANKLVANLGEQFGVRVSELSFQIVVQHALTEKWGRDPFDRLIVANAKVANALLLTKDQKIHRHYSRAIW